jgi:[acyl-carrier-protein] S-malonyltransferase
LPPPQSPPAAERRESATAMSKLAFLFPGQSSQYPGMGRDLAEKFPESRAVFDEADGTLGFPISKMCFEGTEEELKLTENTQPAILTVSVAAYRALAAKGIQPDYAAGHSLGEYSALVAAGALEFSTAVKLVRQRGRYMQEAVPAGAGAMAAILGMSPADVAEVCKKAAGGEVVSPANLNSPEQTVIAGSAAAVKRAVETASQAGAKRAVVLAVSAPFHCSMLMPAQQRLETDLRAAKFSAQRFPVITNVDAEEITSADEARDSLIRQVTMPVRWLESVREMIDLGVNIFVEVGPGKVLSGLMRQIDRSVRVLNVEDAASLQSTVDKIAQARAEAPES